jgi:hypothetical protein
MLWGTLTRRFMVTAQVILSKVKIPSLSNLEDGLGVGFTHQYIGTGTPGSTEWAALAAAVVAFFNTTAAGASLALSGYLSASLDANTNHSTVSLYDVTNHLDGTAAGSPILVTPWTLGTRAAISAMPEGVCAVLGMQAAYGTDVEFGTAAPIPTPPDIVADFGAASTHTGRPRLRARDRGRIYFGPLASTALTTEAGTARAVLSAQFQTDIKKAAFALADVSISSTPTWAMRVWSRRNAGVKLIDHFRTADRPGYQRRRVDPSTIITTLAGPAV